MAIFASGPLVACSSYKFQYDSHLVYVIYKQDPVYSELNGTTYFMDM